MCGRPGYAWYSAMWESCILCRCIERMRGLLRCSPLLSVVHNWGDMVTVTTFPHWARPPPRRHWLPPHTQHLGQGGYWSTLTRNVARVAGRMPDVTGRPEECGNVRCLGVHSPHATACVCVRTFLAYRHTAGGAGWTENQGNDCRSRLAGRYFRDTEM